MGFLTIHILSKKRNTKGHLLIKLNEMANFESFECIYGVVFCIVTGPL